MAINPKHPMFSIDLPEARPREKGESLTPMTLGRMARLIDQRDRLVARMEEEPTRAVEDALAIRNTVLIESPGYHSFVEWANTELGRDADFAAADELFSRLARHLKKLRAEIDLMPAEEAVRCLDQPITAAPPEEKHSEPPEFGFPLGIKAFIEETIELIPNATHAPNLIKFLGEKKSASQRDVSRHIYKSEDKSSLAKSRLLVKRTAQKLEQDNAPLRITHDKKWREIKLIRR